MTWQQLLDIGREAAAEQAAAQDARPAACPSDGILLVEGPEDVLFCRFDGWTDR